ncbi:MAG: sugar phosphate isomerase/epimerase, partial [Candidatus Hydrogenedentes bacterium]|nr:sugar phosphate isomerase/epimerase [Candidatus Hydrogenedentota bacterium]
GAAAVAQRAGAAAITPPPVCVFSKHLHFIKDYGQLAKTAKSLGIDGLDLTVRKGGHVEPANVAADLPKCVDAVRAEGLDVFMVTTDLNKGDDPDAIPILEAASKLKIKFARVGRQQYSKDGDIAKELAGFIEGLRGLTSTIAKYGMVAGYHNHSGAEQVGAPMWDIYEMARAIDSPAFGSNFDVGHATVEGSYGAWRITARLLAPYVRMSSVKDFVWEDNKVKWVPIGQGHVNIPEYYSIFRSAGFAGPVSIHVEYKVESDDAMLEEIRAAAVRVRTDLGKAGYAV